MSRGQEHGRQKPEVRNLTRRTSRSAKQMDGGSTQVTCSISSISTPVGQLTQIFA